MKTLLKIIKKLIKWAIIIWCLYAVQVTCQDILIHEGVIREPKVQNE